MRTIEDDFKNRETLSRAELIFLIEDLMEDNNQQRDMKVRAREQRDKIHQKFRKLEDRVELVRKTFYALLRHHVSNYNTDSQFIGRTDVHENWQKIDLLLQQIKNEG